MMKRPEVCAVILARSGSKRLPGKNIVNLGGKPLIAYTIEAARNSKYIKRVICSTDSSIIARVAKKYGAEVPFIRPKKLALDKTPSIDALLHALDYLEKEERYIPYVVVLLQPSSPFRTYKDINQAIRLFYSKKAKSLVSVRKMTKQLKFLRAIKNGMLVSPPGLEKIYTDKKKRYCRECYFANGAIYISSLRVLKRYRTFWTDNTIPYVMNEASSMDIDTLFDLEFAKFYIKKRDKTS